MKVYHGTTYWKLHNLFSSNSDNSHGLYVTDTAERAQLYADAQASGEVSLNLRHVSGSAIVELETSDEVRWSRRPDDHPSLDKCEAVIQHWTVRHVVVYTDRFNLEHAMMKVAGQYVKAFEFLQKKLDQRLEIRLKGEA